ncbi:putative Beta-galactosidase [Heracleum sosnowskyi]|uniref:beta-galactosidase n=1 Tax=Heracleum sosnowskyi TaxID=360622 RepID=A0AAD8GYP4_9APIA|nr:putative Beta-galactosidase [Heracleum sosnowskyi]
MRQEVDLHLRCEAGESISTIKFASFGTPLGTCGSFRKGACHSPDSHAIIEKMCVGRESCKVTASNSYFQADPCPCPNVLKRLSIEAICSSNTVIRPETTE